MATRRREGFPGKERATAPPQTQTQTGGGASKLKGAVNQISKPTKVSKPAPASSKAPTNTIIHGVSKPQTRKPATSTTATKPRSLNNKTSTPTPKARLSTTATATAAAAPRSSSSLPVKTGKAVAKEELGKRRLSNASAGSGRRSSTGCKTKEITGNSTVSAAKKHKHVISDKNEDVSMHSVPEPAEMNIQDTAEYSYLAEADNTVSEFEKGIYDVVVREEDQDQDQDQELLSSTKIEDMINHADPTLVTGESTTTVLVEHDLKETNNKADSTSFDEDAKEKEVAEEVMIRSKADDESTKEIENPAVDKKQQEKMHGNCKHDSPVSNDVIEETATKLREMRKNKVRALAGAFETVISLQDK